MKKRLLSFTLCCVMIFAMLPTQTFAADAAESLRIYNDGGKVWAELTLDSAASGNLLIDGFVITKTAHDAMISSVGDESYVNAGLQGILNAAANGEIQANHILAQYDDVSFGQGLTKKSYELTGLTANTEAFVCIYITTALTAGSVPLAAIKTDANGLVVMPQCAITWENNTGDTAASGGASSVDQGAAVGTMPTTNPTKAGYKFNGWFDAATGGNAVTAATTTPTAAAVTYYAQWTEKTTPAAANFAVTGTYTYTGSEQQATVAAKSGVGGMGAITVTSVKRTDAGTYDVTFSVAEGTDYKATSADLTLASAFTIAKATQTLSVAPNSVASGFYTGQTKEFTITSNASGDTGYNPTVSSGTTTTATVGAIANGKFTATAVAAGNTTITVASPTTNNYLAATDATVSVDVANGTAVTPTVTTSASNVPYGDTFEVAIAGDTNGGVWTFGTLTNCELVTGTAGADGTFTFRAKTHTGNASVQVNQAAGSGGHLAGTATSSNVSLTTRKLTWTNNLTATNRDYNGLNTVVLGGTLAVGNVYNNETVSIDKANGTELTGTMADANVGDGKTVTVSGYAISGTDAAHYALPVAAPTVTVNIEKADITNWTNANMGTITATKVYDGDGADANVTFAGAKTLTGVNSETFTLTPKASQTVAYTGSTFNAANNAYTFDIAWSNFDLTGTATISNYNVPSALTYTNAGTITQATITAITDSGTAITVTGINADNAVNTAADALLAYAKDTATAKLPATATVTLDSGATVNNVALIWTTATSFDAKGATYALVGTPTGNANYAAGSVTRTGSLVVSTVTPTAPADMADVLIKKFSNATADAAAINGQVAGTLPETGTTMAGTTTVNYTVAWAGTIDANTPNTSATFTGTVTYTNPPAWMTVPGTAQTFTRKITIANKDPKPVTLADATITFGDATPTWAPTTEATGTSTYTYTYQTNGTGNWGNTAPTDAGTHKVKATLVNNDYEGSAEATFKINPKELKLVPGTTTFTARDYDGTKVVTTAAGGTTIEAVGSVTFTPTVTYESASKDKGTHNVVATVTDFAVTGGTKANYKLPTTATVTYTNGIVISPVALTFTLPAISKVYDGTTTIESDDVTTLAGTALTGKVGSEAVTIAIGTAAYASEDVATGITITGAFALSGADAGNYTLTQPTTPTGIIIVKPLTVAPVASVSKTAPAALTVADLLTSSTLATGDTIASLFAGELRFVEGTANDVTDNTWTTTDGVTVIFFAEDGITRLAAAPTAAGKYKFTIAVATNATFKTNYNLQALAAAVTPADITITSGGGGVIPSSGVTFNAGANGKLLDKDGKEASSVKVDLKDKLPEYVPEVKASENYKFMGWSTDNGKTFVDPAKVEVSASATYTAIFAKYDHLPYIVGRTASSFAPDGQMTRAEAATMLARLSSGFSADGVYDKVKFSDVEDGAWYAAAVGFAAEKGIVAGYDDGSFKPDRNISRAEFSALISRFLKLDTDGKKTEFADCNGHWAEGAIAALVKMGAIAGYPDGSFKPDQTITRAEAVRVTNAAIGRTPDKATAAERFDGYVNPFTDVSSDAWYFYDVMEAALLHVSNDFHSGK